MVEVPTLPSVAFGSVDVSAGARSSGLRSTSLPVSFIINTLPLPTFHFHLRWFFRECEFVLEGPPRLWMSHFLQALATRAALRRHPRTRKRIISGSALLVPTTFLPTHPTPPRLRCMGGGDIRSMHACKAIQGSHRPYPFWLNLHQKAFHICKLAASRSLMFRTSALVSLSSLASSPAPWTPTATG